MTHVRNLFIHLADAAIVAFSASAVVAAIGAERKPDALHLRRLGIDPKAFLSLGHG